MYLFIFAV
jgi:hypothetical protein